MTNPPSADPATSSDAAGHTPPLDDPTTQVVAAFIKKNWDSHYRRAWGQLGSPTGLRRGTTWNWPAALVPIPWLLYRRQFLYGFGWIAASTGLSLIPGIGFLAWIASIVLFGIYGDRIILSRAWKSADSALRQHGPGEKAIAEGAASGGVSMVALVLFLALVPGVATIWIIDEIALPSFRRMTHQAYRAAMLSDLRHLRTAEEVVFSDKAKYAVDLPELILTAGVGRPRITLSADSTGFVATVTHTLAPVTCAIAVNMPNPVDSAAPNGDPVCK